METLDWLLTALQSSDEDVASHALLLLWKRVTNNDNHGLVSQAFVEMAAKPWRRLGLLLFADDPLTVRAVVSIITTLTGAEEKDAANEWRQAVRRRVWQSDWRQFIIDKLTDCHSRASTRVDTVSQQKSGANHDLEVATRLLLVMRAVFTDALEARDANIKDLARIVDLLVELAESPLDSVACVSLTILSGLFHGINARRSQSEPALDTQVFAYLEGSKVFVHLLHWLKEQISAHHEQINPSARAPPPVNPQKRVLTRRCQLTLSLLIVGAHHSREVAVALARHPAPLLETCFGIMETTRHPILDTGSLHVEAVQLLASVLNHDSLQATEVVSQLRLSGGLITLSWLQSHRASAVRETAGRIINLILRLSPASDLVRALVEQGCVVICYLCHCDGTSHQSPILHWVVDTLEHSGPQLTQALVQSVVRSTNHKLQRNVILSLLLLSQSSDTIHEELFNDDNSDGNSLFDGVVRSAISASDDASLAVNLLAMVAIFTDKRSTLRLDNTSKATLSSASSQRDLIAVATAAPRRIVELVCSDSVVITADGALLEQHCKVVKQQFESLASACLSGSPTDSVVVDLRTFDVTTVQLFVQLLLLSAQQTPTNLQPYSQSQVENFFTLSNRLECVKCWHAATHATSHALQHGEIHWKPVLDMALSHRHPALMLRAIRAALSEATMRRSADARPHDTHDAALKVWRELLHSRIDRKNVAT